MNFGEYQAESKKTAEGLADPVPVSEADQKQKMMFLALALNGEAGEVAEKVKKYVREDDDEYREELEKELGDVLWYWTQLCTLLGRHTGDVAEENLHKLLDRQERDKIFGQGDNR